MKKASISLLSALAFTLASVTASMAQVTLSLHGTAANNNVKDVNRNMKYGGGAALKFFMGPNVSLGAGVKYINTAYTKTVSGTGGYNSEFIGSLIPIQAMLDFYLTSGTVRPYVGADAGIYINRSDFRLNGNSAGKTTATNFGVAPKAGVAFAIGRVGLFAEYNYHLIFGNKDGSVNVGTIGNINYEKPNKLHAFNVGVNIGIPSSKSN